MIGRTLIPSYLEHNHIDSLRFQLCEIIYSDYKGATFFLSQMVKEKEDVFKNVTQFIASNPELLNYKDNSSYWYPYSDVDGTKDLQLNSSFYPNVDDEITYFCKEDEDKFDHEDYLFDPVKLMFFLMCRDITKMDCSSEEAQKILQLNNQIFKALIEVVGDPVSYNNRTNHEHMEYYFKARKESHEKSMNDNYYNDDVKEMMKREYDSLNNFVYLLEEAFIVTNQYELSQKITSKDNNIKQKIKV
jgi:hypothetical protein